MAKRIEDLRRTSKTGFRVRVIELGRPPAEGPAVAEGVEPMVRVQLDVPLSDARRLSRHLYEWVEIIVADQPPRTAPAAPGRTEHG